MSRWSIVCVVLFAGLGLLGGGCGASPGPNDYSAYITAGGPQCGNNRCEAGDLCVDPSYQSNAGLCRRTPR